MKQQFSLSRLSRGFTLIEIVVALTIMGIIAAGTIPYLKQKVDVARATKTAEEMKGWLEAGIAYYSATTAWPADANTLVTQGYMTSNDLNTPYGGIYSLSVSGTNLRVSADVTKLADLVVGKLPLASVTGTTVTAAVTPPATEAAHSRLLNRYGDNGNNTMFAALNMNNNDITNAGTVNAVAGNISTVTATTGNISTISASAVSVAGNISADTGYFTGALTAGPIITSGLTVNGTMSATIGNITTVNSTTENTTTLNATTVNSGTVSLSTVVTTGAACSPNGSQARDSTGALLSCKSGAWASGGGVVTGGGSRQVLKAVAGQSGSCVPGEGSKGYGAGYIAADGAPYLRFCYSFGGGGCDGSEDTGWVQSTFLESPTWYPNGNILQGSLRIGLEGLEITSTGVDGTRYCLIPWTLGS